MTSIYRNRINKNKELNKLSKNIIKIYKRWDFGNYKQQH